MSRIPVALCGKFESHITGLSKLLLPDYDVVHVCRSVPAATSELPTLLKGESVQPSSGFGSNYESSSPIPGTEIKAIIVGGGFPPEDFEAIKVAIDQVRPMPFFRADMSRSPPGQVGPPQPDKLQERVVGSMDEAKKQGSGEWMPGVYPF